MKHNLHFDMEIYVHAFPNKICTFTCVQPHLNIHIAYKMHVVLLQQLSLSFSSFLLTAQYHL